MHDKRTLWGVGAVLGLLLAYGWWANSDEQRPTRPATSVAAAHSPAPTAPVTAAGVATVTIHDSTPRRVIDGDTFELADGTKVRILGVDSCEMSTPAGPDAKDSLEVYTSGTQLELVAEPGVDRDRYGRLLRYVKANGTDVGEYMIQWGHTGVYAGRNDASPAYVAELRARDNDGRDCSKAPVVVTEDNYVPVPDGDGDGDGKSRFCRRHWYC